MNTAQIVIVLWFVLSVAVVVLMNFVFYIWLLRKGAPVKFFFAGTPFYLDAVYVKWCRERGEKYTKLLWVRGVSLASAIASAVAFVTVVARR